MTSKRRIFLVIACTFLLTQISGTLYLPSMPHIATALHAPYHLVMLTLSYFFLGYALGQILWGYLSDRIGRRPTLLISLALYTVVALLCAFSMNIIYLSLLYTSLGLVSAAYTSIGNAVLKDLYKDKAKHAIGHIGMVMATGPVIGPLIGGPLVTLLHWQGVFYTLGAYGFLSFIGVYLWVPETQSEKDKHARKNSSYAAVVKEIINNRAFVGFVLILGLSFGTFYAFLDIAPFIFKQYLGLSTLTYAWVFSASAASFFIGAYTTSALQHKLESIGIISIGIMISVLGTISFVIGAVTGTHSVLNLCISIAILMLGFGITVPACKGGAMSCITQHNGTAASMMKLVQTLLATSMISITTTFYVPTSLLPFGIILIVICAIMIGLNIWGHLQTKTATALN
jgi:MFS transporter, DHA1 family, multidrug resistance protein